MGIIFLPPTAHVMLKVVENLYRPSISTHGLLEGLRVQGPRSAVDLLTRDI